MPNPVANISFSTTYTSNTTLGNQKYTPLNIVSVSGTDVDSDLVQPRLELFQGIGTGLQSITYLVDPVTIPALASEDTATALPPIAVISSNRSGWIAECCETAYDMIYTQGQSFTDVNDPVALQNGATPWYYPQRVNGSAPAAGAVLRNVYMFVHLLEYAKYRKAFNKSAKNFGIYIIGWSLSTDVENRDLINNKYVTTNNNNKDVLTTIGFGATRFAVITFFKDLFANAKKRVTSNKKIWLVDDDVVFIRNCDTLANIENAMNNQNLTSFGFSGCTSKENKTELEKISRSGPYPPVQMPTASGGLLQQAAVWDIEQLDSQNLNFSPCFVSSGEDLSFSNFLKNNSSTRVCTAKIFKADPQPDDDGTAKLLNTIKENLLKQLGKSCTDTAPLITEISTNEPLRKFINKNTGAATGLDPEKVLSLAIEQLIAKAIEGGMHSSKGLFSLSVKQISHKNTT